MEQVGNLRSVAQVCQWNLNLFLGLEGKLHGQEDTRATAAVDKPQSSLYASVSSSINWE